MKPKYLLPIVPIIVALTGCGQTEINLKDAAQVTPQVTATPNQLVVYPDDRPSIPDGKADYMSSCASCHGQDGAGGAQAGKAKFDNLWAVSTKPIDIYRKVAFGGPDHKHPTFVQMGPRRLWNVVVYTRSLGQPALTDEEIATIDPVFGSNCAVCHGTKGDGDGPLAHNLDPMPANFQKFDRFFNRSDDVLFDHIANGIRWEGMPNFLGKQDRKKNFKFDEGNIKKLVQYVHKFHVTNSPVLTASAAPAGGAPAAGGNAAAGGAGGANQTSTSTTTNTGANAPAITTTGTAENTAAPRPRRHR